MMPVRRPRFYWLSWKVTEADTVGRKQHDATGWTSAKLDHAVRHGSWTAAQQFHADAPRHDWEAERQHQQPPWPSKGLDDMMPKAEGCGVANPPQFPTKRRFTTFRAGARALLVHALHAHCDTDVNLHMPSEQEYRLLRWQGRWCAHACNGECY